MYSCTDGEATILFLNRCSKQLTVRWHWTSRGLGEAHHLQEPWNLAKYAALLREFTERRANGKKVVFVAHSFGGRVLLQMLSQQSKVVWIQRIICMGIPLARKQRAGHTYIAPILKAAKITTQLLPKATQRNIREWWCDVVGAEDYAALESEAMKKTFQNIINADMQYLAQSLRNYNTVFIWGTDDTATPIADAEKTAQEVGATMHRIEGGDHFPFLGDTEEVFKTIFKETITL